MQMCEEEEMKAIKVMFVSLLIVLGGPALADGHDNGATVIDDFGCAILPADSGLPVTLYSSDSHAVTNSAGNTNFWCDFVFDTALCPSDKAIKNKGFLCGAYFDLTNDTMAVTDCEYGVVHLKCQIKANK